jgi:hypothetical protein
MDRFGLAHRISRKQDLLLDRLRDRRLNVRLAARPMKVKGLDANLGE